MDFRYTDEQLALQDTLQRYVSKDYAFGQRRSLAKSELGFSREAWLRYAELGILALPLPERCGGLGGSSVDTMLVMEIVGKSLLLEPYLSSVILSSTILADAGSAPQQADLLPKIAAGETLVALAHYEPSARYDAHYITTAAKRDGGAFALSGFKNVVLDGHSADRFIVSARTSGDPSDPQGISLFLIDARTPGLTVRGYQLQDGRRAVDLKLQHVTVRQDAVIGEIGAALPFVRRAVDKANAALCAEAVGIMTALNEQTLEYLKTRKQFGVPIGHFQALQHRMADMLIAAEQARSMAILAAVRADSPDTAERSHAVAAARAYISQSARFVGQQAVQLHGGMGVVDELIVSHYFKRLTMIDATFGDYDHHLLTISERILEEQA